jgi:hypothetical protein
MKVFVAFLGLFFSSIVAIGLFYPFPTLFVKKSEAVYLVCCSV